MKAYLVKLGPLTVVILFTFGLGLVLGRSEIGKQPVAPPATVTVRQGSDPTLTILRKADAENQWYELPQGYRITPGTAQG
jgi:hypothetical protein